MGSTLEHGIYLPSEGEKNCYQGLAGNWNKVDGALGDIAELRQLIENKFTKEIVTELPTEDINPYCIYMILKTAPETNNIYDEWVYINNAWEYLGNTKVDMTQYYTKQEVNQLPAVASGVTSTKVGNYDAHIANGDIHVTASDKAKWNTVALIKQLRLVNTQVGSSTTIAFANIDDTNGIKVGDKCMDLDGRMFEITAVDTANQTVTVGSSLIDLALDANVMHLSGNETVAGVKTFSDNTFIKSLNFTNEVPSPSSSNSSIMPLVTTVTYTDQTASKSARINLRITASGDKSLYPYESNQYALGLTSRKWSEVHGVTYYYGSSDTEFSQKFVTTDTEQTISGVKTFADIPVFTSFNGIRFRCAHNSNAYITFRNSNQGNPGSIILSAHDGNVGTSIHLVDKTLIPYNNNDIDLGTTSRKWKSLNGINPGALSLPNLNNALDISGYFDLSLYTGQTYTPSVDGWISISITSPNRSSILCESTGLSQTAYGVTDPDDNTKYRVSILIPCQKNQTLTTYIRASGGTINFAKFYPCQGNV